MCKGLLLDPDMLPSGLGAACAPALIIEMTDNFNEHERASL